MRNNVPVMRSHVVYANAAFIELSDFDQDEIIGAPHNFVRHPDMPPQAFADIWATLCSRLSWTALVENRRKNGDYDGVRAAFPRGIVHGRELICLLNPFANRPRDTAKDRK